MIDTYNDITRDLMEISVKIAPEFRVNDSKRAKLIECCGALDEVLAAFQEFYRVEVAVNCNTLDITLACQVLNYDFVVDEEENARFYEVLSQCKRFTIKPLDKKGSEKMTLEFTVEGIWDRR